MYKQIQNRCYKISGVKNLCKVLLLIIAAFTSYQSFAQTGLHFTPEELAVWRTRAFNSGPYKSAGDASTNSPGDWDRIKTQADSFKNDSILANNPDIWKGTTTPGQNEPWTQGKKLQSAAFAYLIYKDSNNPAEQVLASKYATAVKNALLYQITIANANIGNWNASTIGDNGFYESRWVTRLLFAYDYIKETITDQTQRTNLDNWFRNCAQVMDTNVSIVLNQNFPNRLNGVTATSCSEGSYTTMGRDAQGQSYGIYVPGPFDDGSNYPDGYKYTHVNANSTLGNKIAYLAAHYNNKRGDKVTMFGLVGIFLNDNSLKCKAKIYIKEWLKYSVYPDGTQGEYTRNGRDGIPQQGMFYGAVNMQTAIVLADAFARKQDLELYQYTTSDGLHGTQGGNKSIWLTIDRYIKNMTNNTPIYHLNTQLNNRIDHISPDGKEAVWDILFSIANKYYKTDDLKNIYTRNNSIPNNFTTSLHTAGPSGLPWGGTGAEFPGILFMFGQMENQVDPYNPCSASGTILREYWSNVPGTQVSSIPLTTPPISTSQLTSFETPTNAGDNYGQRIRGYVCAPVTGDYTFYIAGDDNTELFLSTDDNPANKSKIALAASWTGVKEWTKYSSQKSATKSLQAGQKYYIEALHKEGTSGDHMAVGWVLPNTTPINVIPGAYLSPYVDNTGSITRELWTNVTGSQVSSIPTGTAPTSTSTLTSFETSSEGDNYGARVRGYVHPAENGTYNFYIAGDNNCELFLSTDANPANKTKIAFIADYSSVNQWTKNASQKSVNITLVAGQKYYIEALHKEATGDDHLAVGWTTPSNTSTINVIAGNFLSPFNNGARIDFSGEVKQEVSATVYPNPFEDKITVNFETAQRGNISLTVVDLLGKTYYHTVKTLAENTSETTINLSGQVLRPGIYFLKIAAGNSKARVVKIIKQ